MKKFVVAVALLALVAGGSVFSSTLSASAESPRMCLGALNMVGATPGDVTTWNPGMVHAMTVNNPNGNDGMFVAVAVSQSHKLQTPPCQD
jgi:hypothetical protein